MDSAWFVPASRIDQYKPGERVHDTRRARPQEAARLSPRYLHLPPGRARPAEERQLLHAAGAHPLPGQIRAQGTAQRQDRRRHPHPHRGRAGDGQRGVPQRSRQSVGRGVSRAQADRAQAPHPARAVHRRAAKDAHVHCRPQCLRRRPEPDRHRAGRSQPLAQRHLWRAGRAGPAAQGRPRALVWLPALFRQQPHRRAARGLCRQPAEEGQQTGLVRRPPRAAALFSPLPPARQRAKFAAPTRSITSCCPTPAWPATPTRWPSSSTRPTSHASRPGERR
jgi:hypothetical protein